MTLILHTFSGAPPGLRLSRCSQPVNGIGNDLNGGVKPEGKIRHSDIVVDCLWDADDVQPLPVESFGNAKSIFPAQSAALAHSVGPNMHRDA